MSRPLRLDFHGAIHLVQVRGREAFNIFFDVNVLARVPVERRLGVPHLLHFFARFDACRSECGSELFGYCVEPNEATFILRMSGARLDAFMQRLGGRYSRYLHTAQVLPKCLSAFTTRYRSQLIAPEYLPHAVRRVHALPLQNGWARRAIDYPFSSARAYLGERPAVQLRMDVVWRSLEQKGLFGLRGYREFMEKGDTLHVAEIFAKGSPLDARIVGGSVFVKQVHDVVAHPETPITRQQWIEGVERLLGSPDLGVSLSKRSQAVLARALVAWHATRSGSASVREVASWFNVTAASLGKAIRQHQRASPALFQKKLPGIEPITGPLKE